jgi:hypothetical protein
MYLKDKRVTCLIAATALIIVATTPVLSDLAMAQMQEKLPLTVTVKNWASCSLIRGCPFGPFMVTIVESPFSGVREEFYAGDCSPLSFHPCVGPTKTFEIIPGSTVSIHAVGLPFPGAFGIFVPAVPHFTEGPGQCRDLFSSTCRFDMPASPVHINVNYHFRFDGIGVGDEGDNSGDTP